MADLEDFVKKISKKSKAGLTESVQGAALNVKNMCEQALDDLDELENSMMIVKLPEIDMEMPKKRELPS